MLLLAVFAQLAAAEPASAIDPAPRTVHDFVALATTRNHAAPPSLMGYRAAVESEVTVLTRRADGEETALSIEQTANTVTWRRDAHFSQHVTGYRARQAGPSLSALAVLRTSWLIPMLYGNEFSGLFGDGGSPASKQRPGDQAAGGTVAVHPFGSRGTRVYSFSGGDTIAVLRTGTRTIPIVRIMVEPRPEQDAWPLIAFRGEIDLDADRGEIVRLRGQFVTLDQRGPQRKRFLVLPVEVVAYVDLESVEINGQFWLPRAQRIETHVNVGGFAEGRSVFRIVSRFRDHEAVEQAGWRVSAGALDLGAESPASREHRLTMAGGDSLRRPAVWWTPLGRATGTVRGDDFADVGATTSAPGRFAWQAQRLADVVRFNRVEGLATGTAATYALGPNSTLSGNATWAWTEHAVRGRLEFTRRDEDRQQRLSVRASRALDITNDFTAPRDSGHALVAALVGIDDYDYVDRRSLVVAQDWTTAPGRAFRVELGIGTDQGALARLTSGPLGGTVPFRANRGVDEGSWVRSAFVAEWNPGVNAGGMATGIGAMFRTEVATGSLDWAKTTLRVNARADAGSFAWALRADGGLLVSDAPPSQQLFELGGRPAFPGSDYKELAGDRAVAAHARVSWRLPVLRAPVRVMGCTCLSSPAPELAVTWHGAGVGAASPATLASIARLGVDSSGTPQARPAAMHSSVELGVRLFGGAATIGIARNVHTAGPWRAMFLLGQPW